MARPFAIAASGDQVFVGDVHGFVTRIAGGKATRLLTAGHGPIGQLALDATQLYFTRRQDSAGMQPTADLGAIPRTGAATPAILGTVDGAFDLILDGDDVLVATGNNEIDRFSKTGGAARTVAHTAGSPISLAVDPTHIYWVTSYPERIERIARSGGAVERVSTGHNERGGSVTIVGDEVLWTENDSAGTIRRASKTPRPAPAGCAPDASDER
jgi:hypothetical protein